jgi:hypothetical protein
MKSTDKQTQNDALVNVYGKDAPAAAKFGVGVRTREAVKEACDARREVKPGVYG